MSLLLRVVVQLSWQTKRMILPVCVNCLSGCGLNGFYVFMESLEGGILIATLVVPLAGCLAVLA